MRRLAVAAGLVVLATGSSCRGHSLGRDEARLVISDKAQVERAGKPGWHSATGRVTLRTGDRVRVPAGSARLELAMDRTIELRKGSQMELRAQPVLLAGDALVDARSAPASIAAGGTDIRVSGTSRLTRNPALVAASYVGSLELNSAGRGLRVPALRQAVVTAAGLIPDRPIPLAYDPADSWDRRLLGDAIDLGGELLARSRGLTAQLPPGEGRTTGFYRQLLPALAAERGFDQPLLDENRTPGETLVGAAIATEGRGAPFAVRWADVFAFRDQGAAWGVVALDQQVARDPLLPSLDVALGLATQSLQAAAAAPPPSSAAAGAAAAAAAAAAARPAPSAGVRSSPVSPAGSGTGSGAVAPAPAPAQPPPAPGPALPVAPVVPPVEVPGGLTGGLVDTLSGLVDTVGGVLGGR